MPKHDKYHPNYKKLYPGIESRPDVLAVLKKSDRKMEYIEVDVKQERFVQSQETGAAYFLPSREDSYDRLVEEERLQFAMDELTPEAIAIRTEEICLLRLALEMLEPAEQALIQALFFEGLSERQYAQILGISQKGVNKRRQKIIGKLKKIMKI